MWQNDKLTITQQYPTEKFRNPWPRTALRQSGTRIVMGLSECRGMNFLRAPFAQSPSPPSSDIVAQEHASRIFGHCNNPTLLVSHFQVSIWELNRRRCHARKPVRKAVPGCCNVQKFYWRALERRYLSFLRNWQRRRNAARWWQWDRGRTDSGWTAMMSGGRPIILP